MKMLTTSLHLLNITIYQANGALPSCSPLYRGEGQMKHSSFFCPTSLFFLFDEPSCSHKLAAAIVDVMPTPLSPDHRDMPVQHAHSGFSCQHFQNVSLQHDSLYFLQALAPACIRRLTSTSECPSSITFHLRYTKPSTCLISLPSKLMVSSSLWCPTHVRAS